MLRIWRPLLGLVVALLVLAVSGAIYQAVATERAQRAYPPPGEMVDLGGHSLHIDCVGRGSPTASGFGGSSEPFRHESFLLRAPVTESVAAIAGRAIGLGRSTDGPLG